MGVEIKELGLGQLVRLKPLRKIVNHTSGHFSAGIGQWKVNGLNRGKDAPAVPKNRQAHISNTCQDTVINFGSLE